MTALLVLLLCVLFIGIDLAVRAVSTRTAARRERAAREAALQTSLTLTFSEGTPSLKRAEVPNAPVRILAVDDESVILDSFRKILVLAGYSVDTVESGPEALSLLRSRDYDLLFTDLKMPGMTGVEVVKAARHLRPDLDVAVVTGFATIETAVETMQHGAVDYVQKPFTEDELVAFANRLVIRRQARLEAQRRPTVKVVAPALAETLAARDYCVPGGAFVSGGHVWARIDPGGQVWIGLDDFARKALRKIEHLDLPASGALVRQGSVLFVARRGQEVARLLAPLSGQITQVNVELNRDAGLATQSPYDRGWVCLIKPVDLAGELQGLRIGKPVVAWYQEEIARLRHETEGTPDGVCRWTVLESKFFGPALAKTESVTEVIGSG